MLHDKRNKTIQIRVSEQELADVLKYTAKFPGFQSSTILRALILGAVYEQNKDVSVIDQLQHYSLAEKETGGSND